MTSQSRSVAWVKALCLATGAMAVALVALHFSAKTSAAETGVVQSFDTISARQVKLVDAEGHPRFILAAPLPNPVVQGKEYPRSTPAYGFQFLDPAGNEMGGLAVLDSIGGGAFCFDYGTAEALCITKTKDSAYVTLLDPPPAGAQVGQPGPSAFRSIKSRARRGSSSSMARVTTGSCCLWKLTAEPRSRSWMPRDAESFMSPAPFTDSVHCVGSRCVDSQPGHLLADGALKRDCSKRQKRARERAFGLAIASVSNRRLCRSPPLPSARGRCRCRSRCPSTAA